MEKENLKKLRDRYIKCAIRARKNKNKEKEKEKKFINLAVALNNLLNTV